MATTLEKPEGAERYFGRGLKRREDPKLITGRGRYTDDLAPRGTLHAAILRSPHAHATITKIDVEAAREAPGVVAVYTGAEIKEVYAGLPCGFILPGIKLPVHPALAPDTVRYVGDGVAIVVAEARYIARDALDLIDVEYAPLPSVTNQEAAIQPGAPQLFEELDRNISFEWGVSGGDFAAAATDAEVSIKQRLINQRVIPNPMEPRAVLANYDPATEDLTLTTSTQIPHLVRLLLALTLGVPEQKLRVIAPDVGGGFGSKLYLYAEEVLCAILSRDLQQPVKWTEGRHENAVATTHGRDHIEDVEIAATKDGVITGLKVTCYANLGAYLSLFAPGIPTILFGLMLSGNYKIPNIDCKVYGVMTNTTPVDAYRGAGRPEANYVVERVVELVARATGMDPVEVRRKNFIQPEEFPYTVATAVTYDSGNYALALDKAVETIGYAELRQKQAELRSRAAISGSASVTTSRSAASPLRRSSGRSVGRRVAGRVPPSASIPPAR